MFLHVLRYFGLEGFRILDNFIIEYFGLAFELAFQKCDNSCMYLCPKQNDFSGALPLI